MQTFICMSVCSMKVCLELSIFILEQSGSVYVQSQVSPRSVSGLAALLTHFVIQSEPKILRLVILGSISSNSLSPSYLRSPRYENLILNIPKFVSCDPQF